jgi:hypothetical protein
MEMGRRQPTREFKYEAARLIKERKISAAQASRDLDVGECGDFAAESGSKLTNEAKRATACYELPSGGGRR